MRLKDMQDVILREENVDFGVVSQKRMLKTFSETMSLIEKKIQVDGNNRI